LVIEQRTLIEMVGLGGHPASSNSAHFGQHLRVRKVTGRGGAEPEDALGAQHRIGRGAASEQVPVVVSLELAFVGLEDVQHPSQSRFAEREEDVGCGEITPNTPHPPADRGRQDIHGALHPPRHGLVAVMHVMGRGRDDDGCLVCSDDAGQLDGHPISGLVQIVMQGDFEGWV